jgi:hypothetical protein
MRLTSPAALGLLVEWAMALAIKRPMWGAALIVSPCALQATNDG